MSRRHILQKKTLKEFFQKKKIIWDETTEEIFPDETKKMQERMKSNRKYKCVGKKKM